MKVICDTNIWYNIGKKTIDPVNVSKDAELIATYINIDELSRTFNLIVDSEYVRNAIKAIFINNSGVTYDPPLIYLKKISDPNFIYDIKSNYGQILEFTQKIANGYEIDKSKITEYKNHCQLRHDGLQIAADMWNTEAEKIRNNITDKKKHRIEDSVHSIHTLISQMVAIVTDTNGLPEDFDWSQIELFVNVLKEFILDLELSKMKIQPNDWLDIFQLIYVQPGNKFWTRDKKLKNLIIKAGMNKYLYEV